MSKQKRKVEWSFDFESMGERFGQFFSDMLGGEAEIESAELFVPRNGAASARIQIDFAVGKASLNALAAESDNLFEARIDYIGEYEFEVKGETQREILLRHKGQFPRDIGRIIGNKHDFSWDIALAPGIPYQLSMKGGVGENEMDLSNLLVTEINLETGIGKNALTLPAQENDFAARIHGGVGKTDVVIPAGSCGQLDISGGVGKVNVSVSPQAAVRVTANAGMGKVNLPDAFIRVEGTDDFVGIARVWESANFADAEKQIVIDFDGGIGNFNLKYFEIL